MNFLFRKSSATDETFRLVSAEHITKTGLYHPWECLATFEGNTWTIAKPTPSAEIMWGSRAYAAEDRVLELETELLLTRCGYETAPEPTAKPLPWWKVILNYCYP